MGDKDTSANPKPQGPQQNVDLTSTVKKDNGGPKETRKKG